MVFFLVDRADFGSFEEVVAFDFLGFLVLPMKILGGSSNLDCKCYYKDYY